MSLVTLTIDRTILSLGDLVIDSDGSTSLELVSWHPGTDDVANDYAESDHLDGGVIVDTRRPMTSMPLVVRIEEATAEDAWLAFDDLKQALTQFEYPILLAIDGVPVTGYDCMPATCDPQIDPMLLREGVLIVTCSIPRQPS